MPEQNLGGGIRLGLCLRKHGTQKGAFCLFIG